MESQEFINREIADDDRLGEKLGTGLGLFSLGLGLAELLAPRMMARLIGIDDGGKAPLVLRAFGLREIAVGVGLLVNPKSRMLPWARVAGDAVALAALGFAMPRASVSRPRTINALAMVGGATAVDVFAGVRQMRRQLGKPVRRATTIAKRPHEVYQLWRDFERLPEFMTWVESVRDLGGGLSHWTVKTPVGATIEYNAEIVEDVPGRRIAWRSTSDATVPNRGSVEFLDAPGGRGTEVVVELQVAAPLGKTIASHEAMGDLRRLKQVLETGEVVHSDASIHKGPHPARPGLHGGMR